MKKGMILFTCLLFLSTLQVYASDTNSDTDTQIQILGCSKNELFTPYGGCIRFDNQAFYCDSTGQLYDAFIVPNACSMGLSLAANGNVDPYVGDSCCPLGGIYGCYAQMDGNFLCDFATQDCSDYDFDGCTRELDRCYWLNDTDTSGDPLLTGNCTARVGSCYEYYDSDDCTNDPLNVSQSDPNCRYGETESAGIPYTIPQDSCECFWDSALDRCGLKYNITNTYGDGNSYGICNYFLQPADCVEGFQNYNYNATYTGGNSLLSGDARCSDRSGRRRCGEPVVKVPFFDYLNLLIVVFLLSLFYVSRTKLRSKKT